jgi:prepilin-type N-terminal cleavage/methylation domain-containing protein
MPIRSKRTGPAEQGYSLIEMLIVSAIIIILATMPIALLRRSREKVFEAEAIRSLGVMALAYDNYYAQRGHLYPNYQSNQELAKDINYKSAEEIWDDLIAMSLLPRQYSGFPHDKRDLMARGYRLSIFPVDYGAVPGTGPRNCYALAMIPYEGSLARRGIAIIQGPRFFSTNYYPTAVPRKMGGASLFDLTIYSLHD